MNDTTNHTLPPAPPPPLSERVRSLRLPDAEEPTGGSRLAWLPWVIVVVLVGVAGLLAMEAFAPIDDDTVKKLAEQRGLNVGKEPAEAQLSALAKLGLSGFASGVPEIALESKGTIVPISLIQVSPKVSGTVMNLYIEEGKRVTKGITLARLEAVEYKADLDRSKGVLRAADARLQELKHFRKDEILQAKADLEDAVAQRELALVKFNRTKRLRESNAVSSEDYDAAQLGYVSMESRTKRLQLSYELMMKGPRDEKIAAAEAEVAQAQADLDRSLWKFENTEVKAPIDGIILSKKTEEGNIVNPSAFSNGLSASLCEMADLFKMEVDLPIAERDIAKLYKNQECRIRAEAFPGRIYKGHVSRIMPMADRSRAAIPVRVRIQFPAVDAKGEPLPAEEQGQYLRPEMGAIVTFLNRK